MSCSKLFERRTTELKRNGKKGAGVYCSLSCKAKHKNNGKARPENLNSSNRLDIYSPFRNYLKLAKRRNKDSWDECNLTLEYLKDLWDKQQAICPVTGITMTMYPTTNWGRATPYQASLDRIDNDKGYIKGNVRFVVLIFNYARNTFADQDVIQFIEDAYQRKLTG